MVFHKHPSATHRFFIKRKEIMNKIIEPRTSRIGSARGLKPGRTARLVAQWQGGVQTLAGYAQRKLRLVLARLPVDANQCAQCIAIVKGGNRYAIR
jgi:hypothetical protein